VNLESKTWLVLTRCRGGRSLGLALGLATVAMTLCCPSTALGQRGTTPPPSDNNFTVDLYQGPVLAPTRVIGLAGSYVGYAEGITGFSTNAASPAVRAADSVNWLDPDIDASFSVPVPLFSNNDFSNSGNIDADYENFVYLTGGAQLQVGDIGLGICGDLQRYKLVTPDGAATVVLVGRYHGLAAWQFFGDQLVIGGGVRAASLSISAPDADFSMGGAAPEVGVLVRPDWLPFRVGASYRHTVVADFSVAGSTVVDARGIERAGGLVVPARAELPWELEVGLALQVGPRPLNPSWINPHDHEQELTAAYEQRAAQRRAEAARALLAVGDEQSRAALRAALAAQENEQADRDQTELARSLDRLADERRARAKNWPRERLLLTAELLVTGPADNAIHTGRFLAQGQPADWNICQAVASGEEVNFSPRIGLEMEPVPMYVQTRFGSYYEPNRFHYEGTGCGERIGRQHFTFGADLKLFSTTWFGLVSEVTYKLQGYGDLAPRYQSFGLGFGVWR